MAQEDGSAAYDRALRLNIALSALGIVSAFCLTTGWVALHLPALVVLGLLPVVLFYLVDHDPLVYAFFVEMSDPRTDLRVALMACLFGLVVRSFDIHFLDTLKLVEFSGLIALLCSAGIYSAARKNPQTWGTIFGMIVIGGFYGWGFTSTIDVELDKSEPAEYRTMVLDKSQGTAGRGRTTYYLDLDSWGPVQGTNSLQVSQMTYEEAWIGGVVCLEVHPGTLKVAWYEAVACDKLNR